jgi:hypothetical protein
VGKAQERRRKQRRDAMERFIRAPKSTETRGIVVFAFDLGG